MPRTSPRTSFTWWRARSSATGRRPSRGKCEAAGGVTLATVPTTFVPVAMPMRILIIEDERDLTEVLCYNLHREGYQTVVAHDGQEGLRKAQMQMPDLIILDLM